MKRALVLLIMFSFGALAQFSGSWETKLTLIPTVSLTSTKLALTYDIGMFKITGTMSFGSVTLPSYNMTTVFIPKTPGAGDDPANPYDDVLMGTRTTSTAVQFSSMSFSLTGNLGPVEISGSMDFSPYTRILKDVYFNLGNYSLIYNGQTFSGVLLEDLWYVPGPAYKSGSLTAKLELAGIKLSTTVKHTADYVWVGSATGSAAIQELWEKILRCMDKWFVTANAAEETIDQVVVFYYAQDGTTLLGTAVIKGTFELAPFNPALPSLNIGGTLYLLLGDNVFGLNVANPIFNNQVITEYLDGASWVYIVTMALANAPTGTAAFLICADPSKVTDTVRIWIPNYMTYTFTVDLAPFKATLVFDDVSTGIQFSSATITLSDIGLCCGIVYDFELAFDKCYGFSYALFTIENVAELCCGISLDVSVKFTTKSKEVEVTPKFGGFGEGCFTLYGDVNYSGGKGSDLFINWFRIDGFKISCQLGDCTYAEFITALSPQYFYTDAATKTKLIHNPTDTTGLVPYFNAACGEFEVFKFGFCGAGCCGGTWKLDLAIWFGTQGTLFDITRISAAMDIPILSGLTFNVTFSTGLVGSPCAYGTTLDIGWKFTF